TAGLGPAGLGTRGVVIGVVGASRIGRRVIALLGALDATILLADPYVPPEQAAALGVELVTLDELLAASDVVTLHAPATPRTRRLLDRRRLRLLRDGATLVNTARGSLIDEAALVEELVTGRIDAVLDVTDPEPPRPDSPLYELPNVFLTPHLAGALGNEIPRLTESALDELARYAAGEPFAYPVRAEEFDHIA
ncbi:MAG: NAD(P)-dependent oxidoreductase, partial [Micromonosporaceae bacterium]